MINFNGKIAASFQAPSRSFKYGDGFFETVRISNGRAPFWPYHWRRMQEAFRILGIEVAPHYSSVFFMDEILKLVVGGGSHRVRLTIWRDGEGLYSPTSNIPVFLIEKSSLPNEQFGLNEQGLKIGIFRGHRLPTAKRASAEHYFLPNIKSCNSLPFVLANKCRQENSWDDILLLNTVGRLACGGSSNIFLWSGNEIYTPHLSEGCVAGTMRNWVIDFCQKLGVEISEKKIFQKDLKAADGVFLTNAISGIRWVSKVQGLNKSFKKGLAEEIFTQLIGEGG